MVSCRFREIVIVCNPFRAESLPIVDQFFMFLCRIFRQGFFEEDLAQRFSVSQSTVSRIIITWSNYLYCIFGCIPIWPTRDIVNKFLPDCFKSMFPNTSYFGLYRGACANP